MSNNKMYVFCLKGNNYNLFKDSTLNGYRNKNPKIFIQTL